MIPRDVLPSRIGRKPDRVRLRIEDQDRDLGVRVKIRHDFEDTPHDPRLLLVRLTYHDSPSNLPGGGRIFAMAHLIFLGPRYANAEASRLCPDPFPQ